MTPPGSLSPSTLSDEQGRSNRFDGLKIDQFPRLKRLRKAILAARKSVCTERARLVTEYFQMEGYDTAKPVLRQARALAHVLNGLPTPIFDDELIVGSTTRHRFGTLMYPEFIAMSIWPELPTLSSREYDPVAITEAECDLLANDIFPYWRDRTVHETARRDNDNPLSLQLGERLCYYMLSQSGVISHLIPDYAPVVHRGLGSLIEEAARREEETEEGDAAEFHQAVQVSLKAVINFAERYAVACEALAWQSGGERARELRQAAAVLRRVPARPAETFQEALQAVWITHVAVHQENLDYAVSFGRLDQFLYPLYQADIDNGRLDRAQAAELLGAFNIKLNDHIPLLPLAGHMLVSGAAVSQAVTLGGLKPDGSDAVNELTYLMLKIAALLSLQEPNLGARLHQGSSPEYRQALIDSIYQTGAVPALYNDHAVIEALTSHGISLEDARDYGIVGCVEPNSAGRTMGATGAILFNLAVVLELAMNDGVHELSGLRIGPATGGLCSFKTFDDLLKAFSRQLEALIALATDGNAHLTKAQERVHPTPLLSSLLQGTVESGRDATRGGAKYNSYGVYVVGLADVADSLTALKELVFNQGRLTLAEVDAALKADFQGHEKVRVLLMRKAPKYGMDDQGADETATALVELIGETFARYRAPHDSTYHVGYWSVTSHTGLGAFTGALPSGRKKGAALASGVTPASGVARKGPTAALSSTAKLPVRHMPNGIANNHKFSRSLLSQPGKRARVEKLVAGFFKRGGMQVQFTVHDKETLLAAQANPEAYRDLLVRVSGYSAYFCDLNRSMQDEIIARTEDLV